MLKIFGLACGPDNFRKKFFLGFFAGLLLCCYYSVFSFGKLLVIPESITTVDIVRFIVSYIVGMFCFISLHPAMDMWYLNKLSLDEVNKLIKEIKRRNIIDRVKSLSFSQEKDMHLELLDINDYKLFSYSCIFSIFVQSFVFPAIFLLFLIYGMTGFCDSMYIIFGVIYFVSYFLLKYSIGRLLHDLIDEEKQSLFWQIKAEFYIDFFNNKDIP